MTRLLITDVTRMHGEHVCIAGLVAGSDARLDNPAPDRAFFDEIGGLCPGDVVEVNWRKKATVVSPHTEDGTWVRESFAVVERGDLDSLTDTLRKAALSSVRAAFGTPAFRGSAGNGAFNSKSGLRSLASVIARNVRVYRNYLKLRVDFADDDDEWSAVPLQDLIIHEHWNRCAGCQRRFDAHLSDELSCGQAVLRVGLTREFQTPDHPAACWLQVNGIYPIPPKRTHLV